MKKGFSGGAFQSPCPYRSTEMPAKPPSARSLSGDGDHMSAVVPKVRVSFDRANWSGAFAFKAQTTPLR